MRRSLPWVLVLLVVAGAALGAGLGFVYKSSLQTPAQWVANLLHATKESGSAHFTYAQVTSSTNPELRASFSGHGTVDFATGDVQVSEVEHDITFRSTGNGPLDAVPTTTTEDAVLIGNRLYQAFDPLELPPTHRYMVLSIPKVLSSPPPISLALNAAVAAAPLDGPNAVASVSEVGPSEADGIATTEYRVAYAPLTICPAHEPVQVLNPPPSDLWVDGAGRLVRVRSTLLFNERQPKGVKLPAPFADFPQGSATSVATLTFANFGDPVRISAPPASTVLPQGGASFFHTLTARSAACHP